MNDKDLCEMFGTSLEQVDADAAMYESGSFDGVEFSEPITGKPSSKMKTTSVKLYDFELKAIDNAAKKEGITRSAFIRRACSNEVVAVS